MSESDHHCHRVCATVQMRNGVLMGSSEKIPEIKMTEHFQAQRIHVDGLARVRVIGDCVQFLLYTTPLALDEENPIPERQIEYVITLPLSAVMPGVRMTLCALAVAAL